MHGILAQCMLISLIHIYMDHQIGRLVSALVAQQIMDNTIILFVSDHGEMLGDHLMFQKAKPFQGSIRVPLFISGPERYVGCLLYTSRCV